MRKSFRHFADITPWNKEGNSAFGLKRNQAKMLALVFIVVGLMLLDPPGGLMPNDFLNIALAGFLYKLIPSLDMLTWLIFTYTIIAWGALMLGLYIYPYNTRALARGYKHKIIKSIKKAFKNPVIVVISLVLFYLLYKWYRTRLGGLI